MQASEAHRMRADRAALLMGALMLAASLGAFVSRSSGTQSVERKAVSLESVVPRQFGEWREDSSMPITLVNPQAQEFLDRLYSEILTRVYVSHGGYRIMLSLAYGSDQRGALQAHKPELCYPAQGFKVNSKDAGVLRTAFGEIPVHRLFASRGSRLEPVTYWFTVGDRVVPGSTQKRIAELGFTLTGRIPDGMLFRVSSIDGEPSRAYRMHEAFVTALLEAVSPSDRKRLSGLGSS